jgi:hypothetical protein
MDLVALRELTIQSMIDEIYNKYGCDLCIMPMMIRQRASKSSSMPLLLNGWRHISMIDFKIVAHTTEIRDKNGNNVIG